MFDFDSDRDGSYLDDVFGGVTKYALTLGGAGLGALGGPGTAAMGAAGGAVASDWFSPFGEDVGDTLTDYLGTRGDTSESEDDDLRARGG
jgi:hypothetical protein